MKPSIATWFFFSFRVTTPRGPTPENGGIFYQGGCRVHGTSIILPDEESSKLLGATSNGHLGPNGGHRGHQPDNGPVGTRRRSPHSASVSSSPLASPIPPLGPAPPYDHSNCSDRMHKSCACVSFIAEHTKAQEEAKKVRYVAIFGLTTPSARQRSFWTPHKSKKSENIGRCGRQNMLWSYLKFWDWE